MMDTIKILVNKNLDGIIFSLPILTREDLKKEFPNSLPVARIFVAYDTKIDFENYHGNLEKHIFPAITGLSDEKDLASFQHILFVNPLTDEIEYRIDKLSTK